MQRKHLLRRGWLIKRNHIHGMLAEGLQYPLVCVVAGHGYGKTTAVADFCCDTDRRLVWMHLLPVDNDIQRFWRRFLEEVKHELPGLEAALSQSGMDFPHTFEQFDDFLRLLANETYKNDDVLLVFDNVENIENKAVQEFISSLSLFELENLCVVLISSTQPAVRSQIAVGKYYYVGTQDLRFTEEEAALLFDRFAWTDPVETKSLYRHTGGWPLALYLIASRSGEAARDYSGGTLYLQVITKLFEQNYYANFSEETRRLLVEISLLPSANLGLIRTLGADDSYLHSPALFQNAFISYNYSHNLLYMHNMYQQFLTHKKTILSDSETTSLYSVAGDWYRSHRHYFEAMKCYWKIRDYDRFLDIVRTPPRKWQSREFTNWILDRLNQLPDEYCANHEEVDFYRSLMYINDAQINRAKCILLSSIRKLQECNELPPGKRLLLGNMYAVMVDISVMQNNLEGPEYAQKALEMAPEGVRTRSEEMMVALNNEIFFLPDKLPGNMDRMHKYAVQMSAYTEKLHHRNGMGYFHLFFAEASFLAGDALRAWECSNMAVHIAQHAHQHDIVANALFLQMRMTLFAGEGAEAEALLNKLTGYISENAPHGLVGLKDCARAFFCLRMRDVKNIPVWLVENDSLPSDIPLDIGRDRVICAMCLYATGKPEKAYVTLMELDSFYKEKKQWSIRVSALILKAACLLKMNKKARAVEMLHRAYDMTWQNGIVTCFAEFGNDMLDLLCATADQPERNFDPQWVNTVKNAAGDFVKREEIMLRQHGIGRHNKNKKLHNLTDREIEVLSYWSKGLSRDEVAGILGISAHGVKKHVTNIYMKLEAVNRLDAIHIATANGLLDKA